jgi:RecA/RadA recombinase
MFGNPETTPGGRALKHLESIRIQMKKKFGEGSEIKQSDEDGNEKTIGGYRYIYILKNRFGPPLPRTELLIPVYYQYHFPGVEDMVFDQGRKLKVITKYKTEFRWNDIKAEGKTAFLAACVGKMDVLVMEIKDAAAEAGIVIPPEVINYEEPTKPDEVTIDGDAAKLPRRRKAKDPSSQPGEPVEA